MYTHTYIYIYIYRDSLTPGEFALRPHLRRRARLQGSLESENTVSSQKFMLVFAA